ncbi:Radial spoke head protein 3 like protein [Vespula squamosa]|uniref:Radial spoke head protein 3 like protein n=1 Tax=Vespula squamosa TaxID=30214 RepID=A0ABD2B3A1_VESSQ
MRRMEECRVCNQGLPAYNIPNGPPDKKTTYTFVKSPRAMLHMQKKYRSPPISRRSSTDVYRSRNVRLTNDNSSEK